MSENVLFTPIYIRMNRFFRKGKGNFFWKKNFVKRDAEYRLYHKEWKKKEDAAKALAFGFLLKLAYLCNMSFQFQQFFVDDTHCAMKVGTDGVLLGAWATVGAAQRVLDLGCGSGLIALMLAQRAPQAQVTGVEIDEAAANDARLNVQQSPFAPRIQVVAADALHFAPAQPFDLIVSNPPYFEEDLLPPSAHRAQARHTAGGGLTFEALLHCVKRLLNWHNPAARFAVVLPATAEARFATAAEWHGLHLARRTQVVTRPKKPCKRVLLEFGVTEGALQSDELSLIADDGARSEQYEALCGDFYLRKS